MNSIRLFPTLCLGAMWWSVFNERYLAVEPTLSLAALAPCDQ